MKWIIGIDEVGRGPLAGPVYVCACAIPESRYKKMRWLCDGIELTDSKLMSPRGRELWEQELKRRSKAGDMRYAIACSSAKVIDAKGIAVCIRSCISKAMDALGLDPKDCTVLLDGGLRAPDRYKNQATVIKGDRLHKVIAAASVLAKVGRDRYIIRQHKTYQWYGWDANKGYGTRVHMQGIARYGLTPLHRRSFLKKYLTK